MVNHIQWISLEDALTEFDHLSETLLKRLAKDSTIRSIVSKRTTRLAYNDIELIASQLAPTNFAHLDGIPIKVTEAAKKYELPLSSVFAWAKKGHLRTIENSSPRPILLNEADVAYAKALAEIRGITRGKALFPTSPQYTPVWLLD